jgi:origin recognition complex subunit 5
MQAVLPHSLPQSGHVYAQIATLSSLRLLLRTGGSATDPLDASSRYRVNCSWEYVSSLGRSVGLEMRDYLATG